MYLLSLWYTHELLKHDFSRRTYSYSFTQIPLPKSDTDTLKNAFTYFKLQQHKNVKKRMQKTKEIH